MEGGSSINNTSVYGLAQLRLKMIDSFTLSFRYFYNTFPIHFPSGRGEG